MSGRLGWLLVLALVWGAACDGSPDGASAPTAEPTADAAPEPTVVGSQVTFTAKGYAAVTPETWTFDANAIRFGNISADTFIAPATGSPVQSSIAVTCEVIPPGITTEVYAEAKAETLAGLAAGPLDQSVLPVSGQSAALIRYSQRRGDVVLHKQDVILAGNGCGWTIALTSLEDQIAPLASLFEAFLSNFTLLEETSGNG